MGDLIRFPLERRLEKLRAELVPSGPFFGLRLRPDTSEGEYVWDRATGTMTIQITGGTMTVTTVEGGTE